MNNRLNSLAQDNKSLVVTKSADGNLYLFDLSKSEAEARVSTFTGHEIDDWGVGLSWNSQYKGRFVSGGLDGKICLFDVNGPIAVDGTIEVCVFLCCPIVSN